MDIVGPKGELPAGDGTHSISILFFLSINHFIHSQGPKQGGGYHVGFDGPKGELPAGDGTHGTIIFL